MAQLKDTDILDFFDKYGTIPSKYYALTKKESDLISKTADILSGLLEEYVTTDSNGKKIIDIPADFHKLFAAGMNRKHISIKSVKGIIDNTFSGKWFCIVHNGETMDYYSVYLTTSDNNEMYLLEAEHKYYTLFSQPVKNIETFYQDALQALGLTSEYKYLTSYELFTMRRIQEIVFPAKVKQTIAPQGPSELWPVKSSPMLNMLIRIGKRAISNAEEGKMMDRGRVIVSIGNYRCSYTPNKAAEKFLKGNINAQKLFDLLQHEAALTGYTMTRYKIPLQKILEIRGLTDMKELKNQLVSAAMLLDDMTFTGKLDEGDFDKIAITQHDTDIKRGFLYININEKFLEGLRNTRQVMIYDPKLQKLPSLGNSYGFARLFEEHKRRNAGQPTENRMSVLTLLDSAPYVLYEELEAQGLARHAKKRIIDPFCKAFDQIEEHGIFTYQFCHRNGKPLTDDELGKLYDGDYAFFASLAVEVTWNNEPDYARLVNLKAKAARRRANNKPTKRKSLTE